MIRLLHRLADFSNVDGPRCSGILEEYRDRMRPYLEGSVRRPLLQIARYLDGTITLEEIDPSLTSIECEPKQKGQRVPASLVAYARKVTTAADMRSSGPRRFLDQAAAEAFRLYLDTWVVEPLQELYRYFIGRSTAREVLYTLGLEKDPELVGRRRR